MEYACVPIENKLMLTVKEAAEYTNIGMNRIEKIAERTELPVCVFCW